MTTLPSITAHRGASADAPENTLAALRLGFAQGAEAGECDVRLTRDGHIVLLHDPGTRRTGDRGLVASAATLAELRAVDVGLWKGAAWTGERIPTLAEVVAMLPVGRRLLVEVKCGREILPELARVLRAAPRGAEAFVVMSFDFALVAEMKARCPEFEAHWIVEAARPRPSVADMVARARGAGLDGLNLDRRFDIDRDFVRAVHAADLRLHVWTVDDAGEAERLAEAGVDSITTNRPGELRAALARRVNTK